MANTTSTTQGGAAGHTPESTQTTQQNQQGTLQGSAGQTGQQTGPGQQGNVQRSQGGGSVQNRRQPGLARYSRDPFAMVQQLADEMDQLFDSFFYGAPVRRSSQQGSYAPTLWAPEVDVSQEGNQLRVHVDLPGISKDNVNIELQEGALIIQGERREERSEGGEQQGFRRSERRYGSFYRAVPLPEGADAEKAQAQMKDGVLEITIPLTPQKQARRLQIKD